MGSTGAYGEMVSDNDPSFYVTTALATEVLYCNATKRSDH